MTKSSQFYFSQFIGTLTIILVIFLAACGKRYEGSQSYTVLTREQISMFIQVTNKVEVMENNLFLRDDLYAVPTLDWVNRVYSPQLTKFLFDNDLLKYTKESNDCDDFSQYALTVAHMMHRYSLNRPKGTTISVGDVIQMQVMADHAINVWIVTDDAGRLMLAFYEPQQQRIIPFNPQDEIISYFKM
jgi:hypothetical protein